MDVEKVAAVVEVFHEAEEVSLVKDDGGGVREAPDADKEGEEEDGEIGDGCEAGGARGSAIGEKGAL